MYGARGHGLRGGSFVASGAYYSHTPVTLRMRGARFVSDVAVSGRVVWDRRAGTVSARLRTAGRGLARSGSAGGRATPAPSPRCAGCSAAGAWSF
jgi:hypothetical protein